MSECQYQCLKQSGMCNGELPPCAAVNTKSLFDMRSAKTFQEWYAFFGGEEMNVSRDDAAAIWEAAIKSSNRFKSLVLSWTRKAQSCSNSDVERFVYEQCAKELHDILGLVDSKEKEKAKCLLMK
jgi:hypothetical protein